MISGKTLWNLNIFDKSTNVSLWTDENTLPMQEWPVCDMMNPALHRHWNDPWTLRHLPLAHIPFLSHSLWSVTKTDNNRKDLTELSSQTRVMIFILWNWIYSRKIIHINFVDIYIYVCINNDDQFRSIVLVEFKTCFVSLTDLLMSYSKNIYDSKVSHTIWN